MTRSAWTFPPLQKWAMIGLLGASGIQLTQDLGRGEWKQAGAAGIAVLIWYWGLKNGYAREARDRQIAEAESRP